MCPALDCIFGGGICRGLKHTTAAFVSQRKKNQDKNKNTPTTVKEIDERIRCSTAEFVFNRVARGAFVSYCANWRLSVLGHDQHVDESRGGRSDSLWLKRQCNGLWLTTAVLRTRCDEIC